MWMHWKSVLELWYVVCYCKVLPVNDVTENIAEFPQISPKCSYFRVHHMKFLCALFAFSGVYVTKVLHNYCHLQAPGIVVIYNLCIFVIFNEYQL